MTTTVTSSPPSPSPSPSDWLARLTSKTLNPPPPLPTPHPDVTSPHHNTQPLPPRDVISNVLSDLFCFGKPNPNIPINRKTSRKQPNPKPCLFAKNPVLSSSAKVRETVQEEEWEDFTGFTETEVTVIDTSVAGWKFDKVLYRRKNEWRVCDISKKRKVREGDGEKKKNKKMKVCGNENGEKTNKMKKKKKMKLCGNENGEKTKKMKKKKKLKFVNKEGDVAGSKSVQRHDQGKAMVAASEKKHDNCSKVQEKRVLKRHIDGGSSSVVLIKSIPITNKKDVSSKSCVKLQKMAGSGGAKQL